MSFARVRALAIVGVLVTCAAVLVAVALFEDKQHGAIGAESCPKGAVLADLRIPEPKNVKIIFYDATGVPGVATNVSQEFAYRQFQVTVKQDVIKTNNKVAILKYGPKGIGAAWLLRAYFLDRNESSFDIGRQDSSVDIVLGGGFKKLATATEVGQSIAQIGRPQAPPGTCADSR